MALSVRLRGKVGTRRGKRIRFQLALLQIVWARCPMAKSKRKSKETSQTSSTKPSFPYVVTPAALRRFLQEVPKRPKPAKLDRASLRSWGFKNSNDARIIGVMKSLGLVGATGEPNADYEKFMHAQSGATILGAKVRQLYAKLFEQSHSPHKENYPELKNLFNIHSGGSQDLIERQIQTFKALCDNANFDGTPAAAQRDKLNGGSEAGSGRERFDGGPPSPATVHIDLHIHLPENKSRRDYEYMFEDIARYLYRLPVDTDESTRA